jgi:membrane-associated protein
LLESIRQWLHFIFNVPELVHRAGPMLPWVVCGIVFVETGLFVGFFLPGDSLLVTAGVFAATPEAHLSLALLLFPVMLCAIVGDQVGYWIGRGAGASLYKRKDSLLFRKEHLQRAHEFYEKYGGRAVILARFVPIVRTFCPLVAGAAHMTYARYLIYDIFGGALWVGSMILGGYSLGRSVPNIGQRIHYVIAAVVLLSMLPVIVSVLRARKAGSRATIRVAPKNEVESD